MKQARWVYLAALVGLAAVVCWLGTHRWLYQGDLPAVASQAPLPTPSVAPRPSLSPPAADSRPTPPVPSLSAVAQKTTPSLPALGHAPGLAPTPLARPVPLGAEAIVKEVARAERDAQTTHQQLDAVSFMLRDFRSIAGGENPVGTNAEIMQAVMGVNPKHARLGPPEGQQLNAQGELIDRWGTPYFFHQLSRSEMEIRSAGPDRVMWTDDDTVTR